MYGVEKKRVEKRRGELYGLEKRHEGICTGWIKDMRGVVGVGKKT